MLFEDRKDAGQKLARKLIKHKEEKPIILSLPRGGVPVGYELAKHLNTNLNVIVSRKLGAPTKPEFGIGAISENNSKVIDNDSIKILNISEKELKEVIEKEQKELKRRVKLYRNGKRLQLKDRVVILVDDGLATGVTSKAAIKAVKKLNPKKIIFAVPVCAFDTSEKFKKRVDEFVCLAIPCEFISVGSWYKHFSQTKDDEVVRLLKKNKKNLQNRTTYPRYNT